VEGHRQKDESEGQTFTKSVNKSVLPDFLSVIFDPTKDHFGAIALSGAYAYDNEGVKAQRLAVVENGILKTFLMSRSPISGVPQSNGHGRRSPGLEVVARQSNLIVESSNAVPDAKLREIQDAEERLKRKLEQLQRCLEQLQISQDETSAPQRNATENLSARPQRAGLVQPSHVITEPPRQYQERPASYLSEPTQFSPNAARIRELRPASAHITGVRSTTR
jgi:hypothetical protein